MASHPTKIKTRQSTAKVKKKPRENTYRAKTEHFQKYKLNEILGKKIKSTINKGIIIVKL